MRKLCLKIVDFCLKCITVLVIIFEVTLAENTWKSGPNEYDFIIVGGGTAGLCLASRLSENPDFSVLVLEKGPMPYEWLDIPAIYTNYLNKDNEKHYLTVPQTALGLPARKIDYSVGTMLGGCSQHNGNFLNRGSPHDYDNWARITGDYSWAWSSMLKYFKRMENYAGEFQTNSAYHGFGGPITVTQPKYAPGLKKWFEAGRFLGYPVGGDPNGPQRVGFTPIEFALKKGHRVSSYTGYIKPILAGRPNLRIVTGANVRRILFNGTTAIGVRYTNSKLSHPVEVLARKEVIVSAGVMSSPTILMQSGIGPEDVLKSAAISPVKMLPVGMNLQDHYGLALYININDTSGILDDKRDLTMDSFNLYEKFGDGPYSSLDGTNGQAFLASSKSVKNGIKDWPDLQIYYAFTASNNKRRMPAYRIDLGSICREITDFYFPAVGLLTRPKSRGRVKLNTTDIDADPVIDFRYLSHPDDLEASLEALKFLMKVFEDTPTYQELGAQVLAFPLPACKDFKVGSDDYWRCYIRRTGDRALHASSTCRMGRGVDDQNAVVDSKLRVIGIKNLRVVDNSIMPEVTNANTQAPAYVIAEKAADMIKETWQ